MSETFLGNPYNNGPTPGNPWADYMASRAGRKHEERMENTRHERNVEMAGLQHQYAQDRDSKNYKRGKKESGREREWRTGERLGAEKQQTGERLGAEESQAERDRKNYKRLKKETGRDRAQTTNERLGTQDYEAGQTLLSRQFAGQQAGFDREQASTQAGLDREQASNQAHLERLFKNNEQTQAAANAIGQTREDGKQARASTRASAKVVRDMAAPTPDGHQTIRSFGATTTSAQGVFGNGGGGDSGGGDDSGGGGGNSGGGPPTPPASGDAPTAPRKGTRDGWSPEKIATQDAKNEKERKQRAVAKEAVKNAGTTGTEVTPAPKKKSKNPAATAGENPATVSTANPEKPQGAKMRTASQQKPQGWSRTKKGLGLLATAIILAPK